MPAAYNFTGEEYASSGQFQKEREKIFGRAWQLMGSASIAAQPGDYHATNIAGTAIFLFRGKDGQLRGFMNACPHRGSPLFLEENGSCSKIVCPYHAAEFDDDGAFSMEGDWFGRPIPAEMQAMRLRSIAVKEWNGLVFAAIDPKEELVQQLGDLVPQIGDTPIASYGHFERRHFLINANWKSYFDQYNEIWHTPQTHPSDKNIGILDYKAEPMNGLIRMTTGSVEGAQGAYYGGKWMQCWPNWTLVLFENGMKSVRINPVSATQFEAFHDFWFADTSEESSVKCRKAADATIDIFMQDAALCESLIHNYASGAFKTGPMHPVLDYAVIEYHNRVRRAVAEA